MDAIRYYRDGRHWDVEKVLRIVKAYYETGSYAGLDAVD
jgi:hypothetical protein